MWQLHPGTLSRAAIDAAAGTGLSIGGSPVTTGTEDVVYAGFTVTASGGTAPFTYSVASGTLPAGITLNSSSGAVSGTPTAAGTYASIVIRATDALSATADLAAFTITIAVPDWALVNSWTYSTNVAQVDFTGLSAYSEVRVVIDGLTSSVTGHRQLLVSINNGSTFLSASGDYVTVDTAGVEAAETGIDISDGSAAQTGEVMIIGFNLTSPKIAQRQVATSNRTMLIPTSSALNAVRINNDAASNLTAGSISIYAR